MRHHGVGGGAAERIGRIMGLLDAKWVEFSDGQNGAYEIVAESDRLKVRATVSRVAPTGLPLDWEYVRVIPGMDMLIVQRSEGGRTVSCHTEFISGSKAANVSPIVNDDFGGRIMTARDAYMAAVAPPAKGE